MIKKIWKKALIISFTALLLTILEKAYAMDDQQQPPSFIPQHLSNLPITAEETQQHHKRLKTKRILVIDGGGIRGIIPAIILSKIEYGLSTSLGRDVHIAEYFDLIAGTSTGGIIALGLNVPNNKNKLLRKPKYHASDLVDLYEKNGKEIFPQSGLYQRAANVIIPKFTVSPLESILRDYFGRTKLSNSISNVFITSYNILKDEPEFFKNYDPDSFSLKGFDKKRSLHGDFLMKDVARATSAAPTYFEGAEIFDCEGTMGRYVDGGVVVNNPTVAAMLEARKIFSDDVKHYVILSIGTGETPFSDYWKEVEKGGLLKWASVIPDVMMKGASKLVEAQIKSLQTEFENQGIIVDYSRIQIQLPIENMALDNATDANIIRLKAEAEGAATTKHRQVIVNIVKGIQKEEQEKEAELRKMAQREPGKGLFKLAKLRQKQQNIKEAKHLLAEAINNHSSLEASYNLAKILDDEFNAINKDGMHRQKTQFLAEETIKYYKYLIDSEEYNKYTVKSLYKLSVFYGKVADKLEGLGNESSKALKRKQNSYAEEAFEKASFLKKHKERKHIHAIQYIHAKKNIENTPNHKRLLEHLAHLNHAEAQYDLAFMFEKEGDIDNSVKLYKKAAYQDHTEAKYRLAKLVVEPDFWFSKAALDGHREAKYEMGKILEVKYNNGGILNFNFKKDEQIKEQAIKWYLSAAQQGHQEAAEKYKVLTGLQAKL